ncbi:hypothetical protein FB451DRAFT_1561916 [Mycena latifolia]|nr:hypothetical protein FB451DRAFT_1561916 [Mycena latifolia]
MVTLAQELVDTIIDQVAENLTSRSTGQTILKSCSLVSRSFAAASQRHLFRSLTLTDSDAAVIQARILGLSPRIFSYVRELEVDLWVRTEYLPGLISLFTLLIGVKRIRISHRSIHWQWALFPTNFRTALGTLLTLPTLQFVSLAGCGGVPSFIIHHALLSCEEVSLTDVYICPEDKPFQDAGSALGKSFPSTAPLHHLALASPPEKSAALHTLVLGDVIAPRVKHLRHLELHAPISGSLRGLDMIALKYSGSIQHLVLHFPRDGACDRIDIPHLPNLPILTLKVSSSKLAPVFSAIVSLPERMPYIETVTIVIEDRYSIGLRHHPEIDRALKNLPRLRRVHFSLPPIRCDVKSAYWLQIQFPMAYGAGLLTRAERDAHERPYPMAKFLY